MFPVKKHLTKILSFVLVISACLGSWPVFADETIRIGGVGSAMGSMKFLGTAFEVIVFRSLGTSGAIAALAKGAIDIGVAGRPFTQEELKLDMSVIEYARTPVVFAVKTDNSISGFSRDDLIKMIKGNTTAWPGGQRARPVLRPVTDAETIIIKKADPDIGLAIEEALAPGGMIVALTAQEAADAIEKTPGAFGISTLSLIQSERRSLRAVPFNGVSPNLENIANGSYQFVMSYWMLTKPKPSKVVSDFVDFVQSAPGRRILEESGHYVEPREK
ncbi:MAG: substrate-binding domain-containing protein [Deltaproteobacteria bacterium]|nr:substrate-binding domain-containing protein [Deltaproteobacteria bacterium]